MVLQRNKPIRIWGWADKGEKISVQLDAAAAVTVKAGASGDWQLELPAMHEGGKHQLTITGKNRISLSNILIGDVYICSGQSNMEFVLRNANNSAAEIAASSYPGIRLLTVKKEMSFTPSKDVEAAPWAECGPATSGDFSAVAYFFARRLEKDLHIPIGLIHTSWGGTNIEAWTSWDVIAPLGNYSNADLAKREADRAAANQRLTQYQEALRNDKGLSEQWFEPGKVTGWKDIQLPKLWEQTAIGNADGIIWFTKTFTIADGREKQKAILSLGPVDDNDITYLNGKKIGAIDGYNTDRLYDVPASLLRPGANTVTVRVTDNAGGGGIYGKPEQLYIQTGSEKTSLAGEWQYKISVVNTTFGLTDNGPNSFPSQLYNAMLAPLVRFPIAGAIWYQGESNAGQAYKYRTLFPAMIRNWREKWGDEFPFLWVQLANFMRADSLPAQSEWAELREAQHMTLQLPKTGEAVIMDVGEVGDIHPKNKQAVGLRLALAAEKVVYDRDVVYSGPVYQSMKTDGHKIILTFNNTGTGLTAKDKYGYLKGFSIAGADAHFYWATAQIHGNTVTVESPAVRNPVAVRYAWGNNPDEANLYNEEGLPASPFRTDEWKGITQQ